MVLPIPATMSYVFSNGYISHIYMWTAFLTKLSPSRLVICINTSTMQFNILPYRFTANFELRLSWRLSMDFMLLVRGPRPMVKGQGHSVYDRVPYRSYLYQYCIIFPYYIHNQGKCQCWMLCENHFCQWSLHVNILCRLQYFIIYWQVYWAFCKGPMACFVR